MVKTGKWYRTSEGRDLRVLQIDGDEGVIEVEYSDGDLEALDLDALVSEIELYPISAPAADIYDFDDDEHDGDRHTLYEVLDSIQY